VKPVGSGAIEGFVAGMMGLLGSGAIKMEPCCGDDRVGRIWRNQRLVGGEEQGL